MRNIPSKDEVLGYIKNGKKTIIFTMIFTGVLFTLLFAYSFYSSYSEQREEEDFLPQDEIVEILDKDPEEVSVEELREIEETLTQGRYTFGVLIEREDQSFYNYPALITEFLISEDVVSYVEDISGKTLLPSPELALEVSEDSQTKIQYILVGTGNEEDNFAFAQAYYQAFKEEGLIPSLQDKMVYMMDEESYLVEEETWMDLVLTQIQLFSPIQLLIGLIIALIMGLFLGVIIVLIQTMSRKEIPFMYELKNEETDKVIYMNHLKGVEIEELYRKLAHSIQLFSENEKLILSQYPIKDDLLKEFKLKGDKESLNRVMIYEDIVNSDNFEDYDEVIILVEQNKTTKAWYNNQRILLERVDLPVTIFNYVLNRTH